VCASRRERAGQYRRHQHHKEASKTLRSVNNNRARAIPRNTSGVYFARRIALWLFTNCDLIDICLSKALAFSPIVKKHRKMSSFNEIPMLDLSLARDPDSKPSFLQDLKKALLEVGFLYISNAGIGTELVEDVMRLTKAFFELPMEEKLRLEMKNCEFPHDRWAFLNHGFAVS
jgi:hypothetical protein